MTELASLRQNEIISPPEVVNIFKYESSKPISVHWELRTILYLGVLLFISGISVFVYQHIDTIGHQAIIAFIILACAACFYYSYKHRLPYSNAEVIHPSPFYDYVVLLACLLFGLFIGYVQFQYSVFGLHYGIATLIPSLVFFVCAYVFDHKGILSLGITGIAAWAGLSVTPMSLLAANDFSETSVIYSAMLIGALFAGYAKFAVSKQIKTHFDFTYNNFAANILYISSLAAVFSSWLLLLGAIVLALTCVYYFRYAVQHKSFWFLLISVVYGYVGLTYLLFKFLYMVSGELALTFGMLYTLASCVGIVLFFIYYKRILKINNAGIR